MDRDLLGVRLEKAPAFQKRLASIGNASFCGLNRRLMIDDEAKPVSGG